VPTATTDPRAIARELVPLVEAEAEAGEAARTLTEPLVTAFRDRGLFALQVPRDLGDGEADAETTLDVYETICRADASVRQHLGWDAMASVADRYDHLVIGDHRGQPDSPGVIGVLDGVVENVREHLLESNGVSINPAWAR